MGLKSRNILGIAVTTSPKNEILEEIEKYLENRITYHVSRITKKKKPLVIVTPNPEQIVYAQKDPRFAQILNKADVAVPDGIGLALASRFLSYHVSRITYHETIRRIPGVEFMEDLVRMAAKRGFPVALIGGRGGVAVETLECLKRKYPGLVGWAEDGLEVKIKNQKSKIKNTDQKSIRAIQQFSNIAIEQSGQDVTEQYIKGIVEKIRSTGTQLVFVGLGAPKQEYVMESIMYHVSGVMQEKKKNVTHDTPLALMSVGGAFDIISGRTPRAPRAVQAIHLEWLWRLGRQPWRWRRQRALLKFLWLVVVGKN